MSKSLKICIAVAAMLAVAAPAMAQVKFSGVLAVQGYHQNFDAPNNNALPGSTDPLFTGDKKNSRSFIDQRFRPKVDYRLNDYVSLTYFAEIDTVWGEAGGQLGTDGVAGNGGGVETKQLYVDFKIPDTKSQLRLGLQALGDSYNNIIFFDDMAAASMTGKLGPMDYRVLYSKWNENNAAGDTTSARFSAADTDLYGVDLSHKYGDFAKAGVSAYFLNHNGGQGNRGTTNGGLTANIPREIWWVGINGDYRFGNFGIEGYFVYQFGDVNEGVAKQDTEAFAASIKGRMVVKNGDLGLRYIYFSEDDDATDNNKWQGSNTNGGGHEFAGENMMIFLVDRDVMNAGKNRFAMRDAVSAGYGLHAAIATANFKNLPMGTFANLGLGGFWAVDDNPGGDVVQRSGKTLGYEATAKVGKMFAEKFELSLRGSYAMLGKFYEVAGPAPAGNNNDPDDAYTVALMARVPF